MVCEWLHFILPISLTSVDCPSGITNQSDESLLGQHCLTSGRSAAKIKGNAKNRANKRINEKQPEIYSTDRIL